MRLIDADELRKNVLKWMPSDPCGKEEKEFPFETDICASMVMEIDDAPTVQPEINCSEIPNSPDTISRQAAIDALKEKVFHNLSDEFYGAMQVLDELPSAQPERKTGRWILDRSGAYCCNRCMEPCASYVMMKPRDKFCKMCGSRNEVTE